MNLDVIYEDNHLLAVNKPAGRLSMGDQTGDLTMVDLAADYLREKYNKPGNVFVGVVHRLDRPVSGVLLFARTSKAAGRLSDQFRRNAVQKSYTALVHGRPVSTDKLEHWLRKDRQENFVEVVDATAPGAQRCELAFSVDDSTSDTTWLDVRPATGRSHQIRVQLAAIGCSIVGDTKYGSSTKTGGRIMLHARELIIEHPTRKEPLTLVSEPPNSFR